MKKKYIVYYIFQYPKQAGDENKCDHNFKEFDTITEAVNFYNGLSTDIKHILKLVTWKTDIRDVTEEVGN